MSSSRESDLAEFQQPVAVTLRQKSKVSQHLTAPTANTRRGSMIDELMRQRRDSTGSQLKGLAIPSVTIRSQTSGIIADLPTIARVQPLSETLPSKISLSVAGGERRSSYQSVLTGPFMSSTTSQSFASYDSLGDSRNCLEFPYQRRSSISGYPRSQPLPGSREKLISNDQKSGFEQQDNASTLQSNCYPSRDLHTDSLQLEVTRRAVNDQKSSRKETGVSIHVTDADTADDDPIEAEAGSLTNLDSSPGEDQLNNVTLPDGEKLHLQSDLNTFHDRDNFTHAKDEFRGSSDRPNFASPDMSDRPNFSSPDMSDNALALPTDDAHESFTLSSGNRISSGSASIQTNELEVSVQAQEATEQIQQPFDVTTDTVCDNETDLKSLKRVSRAEKIRSETNKEINASDIGIGSAITESSGIIINSKSDMHVNSTTFNCENGTQAAGLVPCTDHTTSADHTTSVKENECDFERQVKPGKLSDSEDTLFCQHVTSRLKDVVISKGNLGLGFCIGGGTGSLEGDRPIFVKRVFKGYAAVEDVISPGDEIYKVNEIDLLSMSHHDAWKLLKSLPDGSIKLTVRPRSTRPD